MGRQEIDTIGRGVVLWSVIAGAAAGATASAASYLMARGGGPAGLGAGAFYVGAFALAYAFLVERTDRLRPFIAALVIAALIAAPAYWMSLAADDPTGRRAGAPAALWFALAAPAGGYLMVAFVKAYILRHGASTAAAGSEAASAADSAFFLHVLTLPLVLLAAAMLISPGAALLGAGALVLGPQAGAAAAMAAPYAWLTWPFVGALIGLVIGVMRGRSAALGALRFIAVGAARLATPAIAVASVTLIALGILSSPWLAIRTPYPSAVMIAWTALIWLAFNGIRQSGDGGPPSMILRAPAIISLIAAPAFAYLAFRGLQIRIDAYGLTPLRILGLGAAGIALAHAAAGILSVLGEALTRADRWMPLTSRLNAGLAALTAIALLAAGSPLLDPYAISARDQERRLMQGRVDAEGFDYGFMRFSLGVDGDAALDRLRAAVDHPEAATIRAYIDIVRSFETRSGYDAYVASRAQRPDELGDDRPTSARRRLPAIGPDGPPPNSPATDGLDALPLSTGAARQGTEVDAGSIEPSPNENEAGEADRDQRASDQ